MNTFIDFWNWYSGLFSCPDNKVVLTAWGTTIATLSFIITIMLIPVVKLFNRKLAKIKVEAGVSYQIISTLAQLTGAPPLVTLTVTNLTSSTIFLCIPVIKTSRKINGYDTFVVPKNSEKYPIKLESGEQFKQDYDTISLSNQILSHLNKSDLISFKITTTVGKIYHSNKLNMQLINDHINKSRNVI